MMTIDPEELVAHERLVAHGFDLIYAAKEALEFWHIGDDGLEGHELAAYEQLKDAVRLCEHGPHYCDCEEPGEFCSGVPGVLAHVEHGMIASKVERCDSCERYATDAEAKNALLEAGFREGMDEAI